MISPRSSTAPFQVERVEGGFRRSRQDHLAVEEPLEIRLTFLRKGRRETRSVSVTMRSPGADRELAAGFLFTEGILRSREELHEITCGLEEEPPEHNVVSVRLADSASFDPSSLSRNFFMTSSCGVCGKASLEAVEMKGCRPLPPGGPEVEASLVGALPEALRGGQDAFRRTGGLHAAGLFDLRGRLLVLREDVGRHNALDKVIGGAFLAGELPLGQRLLVVSGRASFEILQKAVAAGIPLVVAVGAPSTLAVEVARRFGLTLVGFAREERFNIYSGGERVRGAAGGRP